MKEVLSTNEFKYRLNGKNKERQSGNFLFVCHALSEVISIFLSIFFVAYIYSLSDGIYNYIYNVAIYEISSYVVLLVLYIPLAHLVEKSNRVWCFRLGIIIRATVVGLAIFMGAMIAKYLVLAGAICGLSYAFYYAGYNPLKQEMVSRKIIGKYIVVDVMSRNGVKILAPIILGTMIDLTNFINAAIAVLVVCLVQITLSFFIKAKRPEGSVFDLKGYFKKLKANPKVRKNVMSVYTIGLIYGVSTIITTLVTVCIMLEYNSNFSLGSITTVCAASAIAWLFIFSKLTKPGKRGWVLYALAALFVASVVIFAIMPSLVTVVIFTICFDCVKIIYNTLFSSSRVSNLKESGFYSEISEHQAIVETMLQISRIFFYLMLMLVALAKSLLLFKIFLVIAAILIFCLVISLNFYEKNLIKDEKKEKIDEEIAS